MAELRQLVIEPKRRTYKTVADRIGDRSPTRYEEATIGVQSTENFHYRPLWAPHLDVYDQATSRLRLSDPDAFLDPRQFYYGSYVINRAQRGESLGQMVSYVQKRDLASTLREPWGELMGGVVIPLRHYEAGANLISINGTRFAWGAAVEICTGFAAMDRLANAQLLTEGGLTLGGLDRLARVKQAWLEDPVHQPARKLVEQLLVEQDWAVSIVALDLHDRVVYPLLFEYLEGIAFDQGVGFFSMVAPFLRSWYAEHHKWIAALEKAWADDSEHGEENLAALSDIARTWSPAVHESLRALAGRIDALLGGRGAMDFAEQQISEGTR